MKKKHIVFLCGELWIMCLGLLGYFSKLNEYSKSPWISKNLSYSFIKRFKRKIWRGFWAQPLPLLQITTLYNLYIYLPHLINFEIKV
jgi:hypothetical protein